MFHTKGMETLHLGAEGKKFTFSESFSGRLGIISPLYDHSI